MIDQQMINGSDINWSKFDAGKYYPPNSVLIQCWMNEGYSFQDFDGCGVSQIPLTTLSWLDCECKEYLPHSKATVKREPRRDWSDFEGTFLSPMCDKCGACEYDGNMPDSRIIDVLEVVYGYEFLREEDGRYHGKYIIHPENRLQALLDQS